MLPVPRVLPVCGARFVVATPWSAAAGNAAGSGGAIAVIQIAADSAAELDSAAERLGLPKLPIGRRSLRRVLDIDDAVVARVGRRALFITPHGGGLVLRKLAEALERRGIARASPDEIDPHDLYPEASDEIEARMLRTLARASSPLAIGALLRQPELWHAHHDRPRAHETQIAEHSRVMQRLVDPPTVAAVGPPNIGKSTLLNALARRDAAIVADQPGTTRDHVGVTLDLVGLVVRWIDTPGLTEHSTAAARGERGAPPIDALELAAARAALTVIQAADLVVLCADASCGFLSPVRLGLPPALPVIRCATRADLGAGSIPADVTTAAARREGIESLALTVRDVLVPPTALVSNVPWRFDPEL